MKNAIIFLVIIAFVIGGFFLFKALRSTDTSPLPTGKTVELALLPLGDSSEKGSATLTDMEGKIKITLALTGAPVGVSQPAHIHAGSCENLGSPRYTLTDVSGGSSETELAGVSVDQLLGELPLAINVHKSSQEAGVYVSCGNIVALGSASGSTNTGELVATSTASSTDMNVATSSTEKATSTKATTTGNL